ncbi:Trehalase [Aphelenchoides besseyi]|nr:Trehalase [Aphelenchoides besseyi]
MAPSGMTFGIHVLILTTTVAVARENEIPDYYKVTDHFPSKFQACDNSTAGPRAQIYCSGRLLEAVMAFKLFNDSKTFVDRPILYYPEEVMEKFEQTFPTDDDITHSRLTDFVEANFGPEGLELDECELTDWTEHPRKLQMIRDPNIRNYAYALNGIWRRLCRQMTKEVGDNQEFHSLIYVPEKFIVPGGRFREFYYWDTYWIIKGLIASGRHDCILQLISCSGMHDTVRSILRNFIYIVERHGMIPNGGRIYYLARSQPPLLTGMFYEYYEATGDFEFVRQNLHVLEKELEFWDKRRTVEVEVKGEQFTMYQFRAESNVPRPESFREDVELVKHVESWEEKSNRAWTSPVDGSKNFTELSTIDTTNIVEVDLNAFVCWNFNILSFFYSLVPDAEAKEIEYRTRLFKFRSAFQKVFFVDEEDGWYDYNLRTRKNNIEFYPSNAVPLFTRCYDSLDHLKIERVYDRFKRFGAFGYNSGIPTDFPNAWPPLQHILIEGLRRSESPRLQEEAYNLAKMWTRVNYNSFNATGVMWEKYDVDGLAGSGGEYAVQAGFGWTNGVMTRFEYLLCTNFQQDGNLEMMKEYDRFQNRMATFKCREEYAFAEGQEGS